MNNHQLGVEQVIVYLNSTELLLFKNVYKCSVKELALNLWKG